MEKLILIALALSIGYTTIAQTRIEWSPNVTITESSFQSNAPTMPEDNMQQFDFSSTFELNFQMLGLQFAFTKNFNSYVEAYYVPSLSWKESGDLDEQILQIANLQFDLVELYARKCRKRMYESKKLGSDVNFFSYILEQINNEHHKEIAVIQSELRTNKDVSLYLKNKNEEVNAQIDELSDFCKQCKPSKKKKAE